MNILMLNKLALDLVARDFSKIDGRMPVNGGPTKTSRALAIIHLAARDAYAMVTKHYPPHLATVPKPPTVVKPSDGLVTALSAGLTAARKLYPDETAYIDAQSSGFLSGGSTSAIDYGAKVADFWMTHRLNDGSQMMQTDREYKSAAGHHRPDPLDPSQEALGRHWGTVTPFVIGSVAADAPLEHPPKLGSEQYLREYEEVYKCGKASNPMGNAELREKAIIGIAWGYDGANKLGTPPRLYNQVVVSTPAFAALHEPVQINVLAAINAAMADAGIAAWHWKYLYDLWRPVVGIREAAEGWGPDGFGDGSSTKEADPFWLPLGAPASNQNVKPNGTPGFPAYPSGHSTFGSACFETFAGMIDQSTAQIRFDFVSDEFNGVTTDNHGAARPRYIQRCLSLRQAIHDNSISRIYLGVHWRSDATGGAIVGDAIAKSAVAAFKK